MPAVPGSKSTVESSIVPSESESVLVTLNVTATSSGVVASLASATGGLVLTIVIKIVSVTQIIGNGVPSSQISTTMVSFPTNPLSGVYVNVPSILITIEPLSGESIGTVFTTKFPSTSLSPISVRSPPLVPPTGTEIYSLSTTGASLIGVISIKIVSVTQIAGNGVPSSQIVTTTVSFPT